MNDRLSYEEKKNYPIRYSASRNAESTRCPMPHTCELPKPISVIVLKISSPGLPGPYSRAAQYGVDVESPTVLSYAKK